MPQTIEQAAALYLSEIRRVQPRGPYHLVGHSYGGRVVWEMAQVLARAGETVGLLALIDTLYDAQHDIPQEPSVSRARRHLSRMSSLMPGP
jgi:thioesterase domain-containing protein